MNDIFERKSSIFEETIYLKSLAVRQAVKRSYLNTFNTSSKSFVGNKQVPS